MMRAMIFNSGASFTGIAFEGEDAYDRNILRERDFLKAIIVPDDLAPEDVLHSLNSGKKRILKTGSDICIEVEGDQRKVKHFFLSKR